MTSREMVTKALRLIVGKQEADSQISTSHDKIKFLLIFYVDSRVIILCTISECCGLLIDVKMTL